jgi:hypothetical protein
MNRRELLGKVGLGSLATAALVEAQATPASADDDDKKPVGFHFVCVSHAPTGNYVAMAGDGKITSSNVVGDGIFIIFNPSAPGVPKPIVATGSWKAKSLISFDLLGTYGAGAAGILKMLINLVPEEGPVAEATLKVVCNLAPAGLDTGQPEGYTLTVSGTSFVPFVPAFGVTIFSVVNEHRD